MEQTNKSDGLSFMMWMRKVADYREHSYMSRGAKQWLELYENNWDYKTAAA